MEPKEVVLNLLAHKIEFSTFKKCCKEHPEIPDWLQSIVPPDWEWSKLVVREDIKKRLDDIHNGSPSTPEEVLDLISKQYDNVPIPYDIRLVYEQLGKSRSYYGHWLNVHYELVRLLKAAFPNEPFEISDYIDKTFNFMISVCPDYIGGSEINAHNVLENLYEQLPEGSMTARKKVFRELLKSTFHLQGGKHPYWIQPPEWPMGKNSPMQFISQFRKGYLYKFVFQDVDTGEQKTVEQFA